MRFGVRAGVQLYPVGTDGGGMFDPVGTHRIPGIGEQADPATQATQALDQRAQAFAVTHKVESVIGRQLVVAIGHQRGLGRTHDLAQFEKSRITGTGRGERVALEVELDAALGDHRRQREHVGPADVARVRARVHGDPVGAGVETRARGLNHVGVRSPAGIAQDGNLVEVDAEKSHMPSLAQRAGRLV